MCYSKSSEASFNSLFIESLDIRSCVVHERSNAISVNWDDSVHQASLNHTDPVQFTDSVIPSQWLTIHSEK